MGSILQVTKLKCSGWLLMYFYVFCKVLWVVFCELLFAGYYAKVFYVVVRVLLCGF